MSSLAAKARFSKLGGSTGTTNITATSSAGGSDGSFGKLPSFRYDPIEFIQASKITTGTYAGGYRVAPFGYLNVYFACLGLYHAIEEVGTDARDFVNMVLANLVVANDGARGYFTIYDVENLDTTPTIKDPDSHDSYASVLNMLAYAYAETYNDWAWYATNIAVLKDIMYWNVAQSQKGAGPGNGMIRTFKTSAWGPYYNICLTEDNSECYAGLNALILGLTHLADADAAYYTTVRDGVGAGMNSITEGVWDETNQRWFISDGRDPWLGTFYADAVTQVFPQVYGVKSGDPLLDIQRYDAGWATLEATSPQWYSGAYDDFPWMILGLAAVMRGSLYEAQLQMAYTLQKKVNNTGTMPINDSGLYYAILKGVRGIGSALSVSAQARSAVVIDSIADADIDHAPSRNAVFDALALKAPLLSPAFLNNPTAPTQARGDSSTLLATTAFARNLFGADSTAGVADWNDVSNTVPGTGKTLLAAAAANGPPSAGYSHPFNFEYSSKDGTGSIAQLAIPYGSVSGAGLFYRNRYAGVFSSWYRIWDSNNDGAGGGLDADLLDGQQGAWYSDLANATGNLPNARLTGIYTGVSLALGNGKAAWDGLGTTARAITHAASYRSGSSAATGAIVFYMPWTSALMMNVRIVGYLYAPAQTIDITVKAYKGTQAVAWSVPIVHSSGTFTPTVQLGMTAAGEVAIILGGVASTWSYPHLSMMFTQTSHTGASDASATGWLSTLVTDLSLYTNLLTPVITPLGASISGSAAQTLGKPSSGSTSAVANVSSNLAQYAAIGAATGAIVFNAPTNLTSVMLRASLKGHIYNTANAIVDLEIVTYRGPTTWNSTYKSSKGIYDPRIRLAINPSGNACIIVEDIATVWSNPHFTLDGAFHYSSATDALAAGWTVALVTDLSAYTYVSADVVASPQATGITGNAGTATSAAKLTTGRTINLSGKASGTATLFDGQTDVVIPITTITLAAADIPALDWTKIATGKPTTLAGYGITDPVPPYLNGVCVIRSAGIVAGGYYAERYSPKAYTFTKFFALAEGTGQFTVNVKVNSVTVYGPVVVAAGVPVVVSGLNIAVAVGATVVMEIGSVTATVTTAWARIEG